MTIAREARAGRIRTWLEGAPVSLFSIYAIGAAFITYFGMYAFRKPYTAATFADYEVWGLGLKQALIISQVLGYALSKWLGVKFISEMPAHRRGIALVVLIVWAQVALVMFALVPPKFGVAAMFLNGLPLGAVWGLVFGYLEGRRSSEILGAGLSCSYIIAGGAVQSVGKWLMTDHQVSEAWMPAAVGFLFLPIFLVTVWLLKQLPPPNAEDIAERTERLPMSSAQRREFLGRFFSGLMALTALYFFLTAYRGFRSDFAAEIWTELGYGAKPSVFALSELPIAFAVMFALALLYRIKDNRLGLLVAHGMMFAGAVIVGLGTLAFDAGLYSGFTWMIVVGLGLYLSYVPYGCVLFDRMIAATGVVATAVFMIYLTDAAGYAGNIGIILFKNFGQADMSVLAFFRYFSYFTAVFCAVCFALSALYFARRSKNPDVR